MTPIVVLDLFVVLEVVLKGWKELSLAFVRFFFFFFFWDLVAIENWMKVGRITG